MCFAMIIIMFERWTSLRMLSEAVEKGLLSHNLWNVSALITSFSLISVLHLSHRSSFAVILTSLAQIILSQLLVAVLIQRRIKNSEEEICIFVDEMIVEMKSGAGFLTAYTSASLRGSDFLKFQLKILAQSFLKARFEVRTPSLFLQIAFQEIFDAHRVSHNTIARLSALRHRMRVMSDFRRKSGQATAQIRAQVLVMVGLYIATIVFMGIQVGLGSMKVELAISLTLFCIGGFLMNRMGKRHKWKI